MNRRKGRAMALAAIGVGGLLASSRPAGAQVRYEAVVLTGQQAPGAPAGAQHNAAYAPVNTPSGRVAFYELLKTGSGGVTSANEAAVFGPGSGGALTMLAREGDQAPGTAAGTQFGAFYGVLAAGDAGVAFNGELKQLTGDATSSSYYGVWGPGAGGALTNLARQGRQAPGVAAGGVFSGFGAHAMSNSGRVAFYGGLATGSGGVTINDNEGIWATNAAGQLQLIARRAAQAPVVPAGSTYFQIGNPVINDSGWVAFKSGVTPATDAIFGPDASGNLTKIARTGDAAPGTESASVTFTGSFSRPSLNNAGQVAFSNALSGTPTSRDVGVWATSGAAGGPLALVAREGQAAPGIANVQYLSFDRPLINGAGRVAFGASLKNAPLSFTITTDNDTALFAPAGNAALALVAREGDAAPGAPAGAPGFGRFDQPLLEFAFNALGQVAFKQSLGLTSSVSDEGIWMTDPAGALHLVALEGEAFAPAGGKVVEYVQMIGGSGGQDGLPTGLNDSGTLAFVLSFEDGTSGVYTASVPEPSGVLVAVGAMMLMAGRGRRRGS